LEDGDVVGPFGRRPEIPELPENAANPSGKEEAIHAAVETFGKIAEDGGQAEAAVDGVEEEEKADPNETEAISGDLNGKDEGENDEGGAAGDEEILHGLGNLPGRSGERREDGLDEVGGLEERREDGGAIPDVGEHGGGAGLGNADPDPILDAEIVAFENEIERREWRDAQRRRERSEGGSGR